jgi:hypothetical protein
MKSLGKFKIRCNGWKLSFNFSYRLRNIRILSQKVLTVMSAIWLYQKEETYCVQCIPCWNILCAMYTVLKHTVCNVYCNETYCVQCILYWNIQCAMYTVLKRTICNIYCIETYFVQCILYWNILCAMYTVLKHISRINLLKNQRIYKTASAMHCVSHTKTVK